MKTNHIYKGDCISTMQDHILNNSINLIFADPPYNLSGKKLNLTNNKTGGSFYKMNEDWDTWTQDDYILFTHKWLSECYRVLKDNGSLYISTSLHNIGEIIMVGKSLGMKFNNIITWSKTNAMPSITKRMFTHSTEHVCWFVKGKNWKFNYEQLKSINPNRTKDGNLKQMRDFMNFIELPIVQGKERIRGENGRAIHPTQKPQKLLEVIITASSDEGDIVLDPFFGSGTTGFVAKQLNRNWIGIETNDKYIEIAETRIFGNRRKHA